jgi:hypothetical protein
MECRSHFGIIRVLEDEGGVFVQVVAMKVLRTVNLRILRFFWKLVKKTDDPLPEPERNSFQWGSGSMK